jgi:DNA-binding beta-propeller fold protein YncE
MKVTSKVKLGIMCRGIAYARGNYYVSDALDTIHVYRLSGKKDRTISLWEPNKEDSGVNNLAITKDASRIYVANGKNGLIVLDNTGNVLRKFNGPELKCAHSCYVMENGNVLVSGANSNNVVQLTRDGELIGEVIGTKEGVWGVYAVCCDKENSKLCISRYCQSDVIVYNTS